MSDCMFISSILYLLARFVHLSATMWADSTCVHWAATAFVVLLFLPYDLFPCDGSVMLPFRAIFNMADSCTKKVQRNVWVYLVFVSRNLYPSGDQPHGNGCPHIDQY